MTKKDVNIMVPEVFWRFNPKFMAAVEDNRELYTPGEVGGMTLAGGAQSGEQLANLTFAEKKNMVVALLGTLPKADGSSLDSNVQREMFDQINTVARSLVILMRKLRLPRKDAGGIMTLVISELQRGGYDYQDFLMQFSVNAVSEDGVAEPDIKENGRLSDTTKDVRTMVGDAM